MQLEYDKGNWNNLLEYLRSLDPDMVMPLCLYLICISLQLKVWKKSLPSSLIHFHEFRYCNLFYLMILCVV